MKKFKGTEIEEWATQYEKTISSSANRVLCNDTQIQILLQEKELNEREDIEELLEKKKLGYASVIYLRVKYCHSFKITKAAILFLDCWMRNFGDTTMTVNYLQFRAHKFGVKEIDCNFLCSKVYPDGFLSQEDADKLWALQKIEGDSEMFSSDNLLDYKEAMKSIEL